MAKTKGALFSLQAQGTIAGILTYQGRKGFRHVHLKATPHDPKTTAQLADRAAFATVVAAWQALSDSEKKAYDVLGPKYGNRPGFNIYIKLNKAEVGYWTKFGQAKFGMNKKFGGP